MLGTPNRIGRYACFLVGLFLVTAGIPISIADPTADTGHESAEEGSHGPLADELGASEVLNTSEPAGENLPTGPVEEGLPTPRGDAESPPLSPVESPQDEQLDPPRTRIPEIGSGQPVDKSLDLLGLDDLLDRGSSYEFIVGFESYPGGLDVGDTYENATIIDIYKPSNRILVQTNSSEYADRVRDNDNVLYVDENRDIELEWVPNDDGDVFSSRPARSQILAENGWDVTLGVPGSGRSLCIVDTGIRQDHLDLQGTRFKDEKDFIDDDNTADDADGHGTKVAGIAVATSNNAEGLVGMAQVDTYIAKGVADTWVSANSINWCDETKGADIISMSWGDSSDLQDSIATELREAHADGKLLISSAGNNDCPVSQDCVTFPANMDEVMAVACTDDTPSHCTGTSEGPEIEIAAPGYGNVACNAHDSCYVSISPDDAATSFSAAYASGAAALLWSYHPDLTAEGVRFALKHGAQLLGATADNKKTGFGEVEVRNPDSADRGAFGQVLQQELDETFDGDETTRDNTWGRTGLWHFTDNRAATDPDAAWYGQEDTGDYDTGSANSGTLTREDIISTPDIDPKLTFLSWHETETTSDYDKKMIQVRERNDGSWGSWNTIESVSHTTKKWEPQSVSLSSFSTGSDGIQVRWKFDTVDSANNNMEGWYVDEAQITGGIEEDPNACFSTSPSSKTVETNIDFDGSCSWDTLTEDSNLDARWDWTNDGTWDTGWQTSLTQTHSYDSGGDKTVALQVRDESGRTHTTTRDIYVDGAPTACFDGSPQEGTQDTTFSFDASCSSDSETSDSDLEVRWDWTNDGSWDTAWSSSQTADHSFSSSGEKTVIVQVRDEADLTDGHAGEFLVNNKPNPCFDVDPSEGSLTTTFDVDASCSSDDLTDSSFLEVRWNFTSSGSWSPWTTSKTSDHSYDNPGTKTINLQVRDEHGSVAHTAKEVTVVNHDPTARFSVDDKEKPILTEFDFDASDSSDAYSDLGDIEVRWDWNGDDIYDTTWRTEKQASHSYTTPGERDVTLQVRDEHDARDSKTKQVRATLVLLDTNFEGSTLGGNWSRNTGTTASTDCGSSVGNQSAVSNGDATRRFLASQEIDADSRTNVGFAYTTGYDSGSLSDSCPAIDESAERPEVQVSTDGGHTWTTLQTLPASPNGFTYTQVSVPANQGTEHTRIRWIQFDHDGRDADMWAVDDVTVDTAVDANNGNLTEADQDLGGLGPAGYAFQRVVTVNNTGDPLTDHPVEVTFDSQALIDAGKMQADCDDLRFTSKDNMSLLDHEVTTGCGNATTKVWIHVPYIPSGTKKIHMHYGDVYGGRDAPVDAVNESDTTDPQPTTSLGPEKNQTSTADDDADGIPDELEATLCPQSYTREIIEGANLGSCDSSTDYNPLDTGEPYTIRAPEWTDVGVDQDGDGLPATVAIEWLHVTINPSGDSGPSVRNGGVTTHTIDSADTDASLPNVDFVCNPIQRQTSIALGPDDDGDGVPGEFEHSRSFVCVDSARPHIGEIDAAPETPKWELDPDDSDATTPSTSLPVVENIPQNATFDHDNDEDGLVNTRYMGRLNVTWDNSLNETLLHERVNVTSWDPDDSDATNPKDLSLTSDSDDDLVPDDMEPEVCEREDSSTDLDGYCTDLGTNFHPSSWYQRHMSDI